MTRILILNGPGLSTPDIADPVTGIPVAPVTLHEQCDALCNELDIYLEFRQTEQEKELRHWISEDTGHFDALIISPAAQQHAASFDTIACCAALDSIAHLNTPVIEVHLENIFTGDTGQPLRPAKLSMGLICGLGIQSYLTAIRVIADRVRQSGA